MAATAERTTIATSGLSKRYDEITALDDVSVAADATRPIGLLGANGAGKSTLMRALLGLSGPTRAACCVLGIDAAARVASCAAGSATCPSTSCLPMRMTARDLVVHLGELRGLPRRVAVLRASRGAVPGRARGGAARG